MRQLLTLIIKSFDFSGSLIIYWALSGAIAQFISPTIGKILFIYSFIAFYLCMSAAAIGFEPQKGINNNKVDRQNETSKYNREQDTPEQAKDDVEKSNQDIEQDHNILDNCESEPERIFLSAMIKKYQLVSSTPFLLSGDIMVELQRVIGRHRVDFLINNRFVVEIDGRKYHQNRFYGDRMRDQDVIEEGYIVIRFPAAQVFRDAQGCCEKVDNIIKAHS